MAYLNNKAINNYKRLCETSSYKFERYYLLGIDSNMSLTYTNQELVKCIDFNDNFYAAKQEYEVCRKQKDFSIYEPLYEQHSIHAVNQTLINEPGRYKKGIQKYNFYNKVSNIIKTYRGAIREFEHENEITQNRSFIHNFTNTKINKSLNKILIKGPNFIPTTAEIGECDGLAQQIKTGIEKLAKKNSRNTMGHGSNTLLKYGLNNPNIAQEDRDYIINTLDQHHNINFSEASYGTANISMDSYFELRKLANNKKIICNTADKNLGLSINSTEWYKHEYKRQLDDKHIYMKIEHENINKLTLQGINNLIEIKNRYENTIVDTLFNVSILTSRELKDIKIPTLNITPKVHKLKSEACPNNEKLIKGRPIVNGFASINVEPSKLLGQIYKYVINKAIKKAEDMNIDNPMVTSSQNVVEHLNSIDIEKVHVDDLFFVSFDFSSLYTSISNKSIYDMILYYGQLLELDSSMINLMTDLHGFIKDNAFFDVANKHMYLQRNGLAMGSYDSCEAANLVLFKAELNMLKNKGICRHIVAFYRFIDDGCLIMKGNLADIKQCIQKIVLYYPSELEMEFTINKFQTVFLDLTIGMDHDTFENGSLHYRIYQKPFNAYSYTHYDSNHPKGVFKGIISTECHRYQSRSCNEEEYNHMVKLLTLRLIRCGYPEHFITKHVQPYKNNITTYISNKEKHKKMYNNDKRCTIYYPVRYNKYTNTHNIHAKVYRVNGETRIIPAHTVGKKTKTILLTKKKLHDKLGVIM